MCKCKIQFVTGNLLVAFIPLLVMDFLKIESRHYSTPSTVHTLMEHVFM